MNNPLRQKLVWLIEWRYFDRFILLLIIANSVVLALTDYSSVDEEGGLSMDSWRNQVVEESEPYFTSLFTLECVLKIISMGFIMDAGSYLRDGWNVMDFVVVTTGLMTTVPGMPNVSAFRTVRVLRPLRSLTVVPGMRLLVTSLLRSIPALLNVVALLLFVFAIFGILGIQIWQGLLHARCRLTEYPIQLVGGGSGDCADPRSEFCIETIVSDPTKWEKCHAVGDVWDPTARWDTPVDCFWPVDNSDERVCSLPGSGAHECRTGTWCGSNYDVIGQPRFNNEGLELATFVPALNWGFTNFDTMPAALLTIFQMITMEGWTDVMYQVQDAHNSVVAAFYFIFLILFGSFFLLNLTLAVIWDNFSMGSKEEDEKAEVAADEARREAEAAEAEADIGGGGVAVPIADGSEEEEGELGGSQSCITSLVLHPAFSTFVVVLIVANTVVLAGDRHPMDETLQTNLEIVNFILTMLFTLEMILKLWGLGPKEYAREAFNLFDAFIVTVSLVEMIILPPPFLSGSDGAGSGGGGALSALRTFRLFRVFKLARSWRSLNVLLKTIVKTLNDVANFGVLLLLFMYIFALIGMQFFANKFCFDYVTGSPEQQLSGSCIDAERPRAHFDDLLWAFVTIFQVLTGENWNVVMYDAWRAGDFTSTLYFVLLVVMGNFIVLNLFLAILLGNFEGMEELAAGPPPGASTDQNGDEKPQSGMLKRVFSSFMGSKRPQDSARVVPETHATPGKSKPAIAPVAEGDEGKALESVPAAADAAAGGGGGGGSGSAGGKTPAGSAGPTTRDVVTGKAKMAPALEQDSSDTKVPPPADAAGGGSRSAVRAEETPAKSWSDEESDEEKKHPPLEPLVGHAVWIFGPTNCLRVAVAHVVRPSPIPGTPHHFDNLILFLIGVSSVLLAVDNPLNDPSSGLVEFLTFMDIFMTVCFTIEMVMKIITMQFVMGKGAYLRSGWNILDFIIVIVSVLSLSASGNTELRSLRSLRTLRALRPLRVISRRPGLRLVVNALFSSTKAIMNVLFVCVLFFMIFAIVGVSYFKGTFMQCQGEVFDGLSNAKVQLLEEPLPWNELSSTQQAWFEGAAAAEYSTVWTNGTAPTSKVLCDYYGAEWDEAVPQNFNNIVSAMGTLFEMSTTEGWVDIMYAGVDATAVDMQPIRDIGFGWTLFFMAFMVVGSFFVMNLFVGVVIDNFNTMKEKLGDNVLLTDAQKEWVKTREIMLKIKPMRKKEVPDGQLRQFCYSLCVNNKKFEIGIMACIVLNTVVMSMTYFGEPESYSLALEIVNYVFAGIFTIEAVIKLIALHREYFHDGWNVFDFLIVLGTNVGIFVHFVFQINVGSMATVVRTFRIGRIFRLVKSAKSLRQLFQTLLLTLPGLGNIGGLLFLLFFIYAVMGVQLYAHVQLGEFLNHHAHFQDFWTGFVTLMRACTGESWNYIMYDLANERDCDPDLMERPWEDKANMCGFSNDEDCVRLTGCGAPHAFPFFISFTLFVTFVFLNLFIAVILEGFGESGEEESMRLSEEHFRAFADKWSEFDPKATCFIKTAQLFPFMQTLDEPMGFGEDYVASAEQLQGRIARLGLPIYEGNRVHFKDVASALAQRLFEESAAIPENHKINKEWSKKYPPSRLKVGFDVQNYYAARSIQNGYHAFKFRRSIEQRIADKERTDRDLNRARPPTDD